MKYMIEAEQANTILAYLGKKPYQEVAGLVSIFHSLPRVEEKKRGRRKQKSPSTDNRSKTS